MDSMEEMYKEQMISIGDHKMHVLSYRMGRDFVCIVSNADPRATVCRSKAETEERAMQAALELASQRLTENALNNQTLPVLNSGAELVEICLQTGSDVKTFSPDSFRQLDQDLRAELFLAGSLTFYDSNHHLVSSGEAIRLLLCMT